MYAVVPAMVPGALSVHVRGLRQFCVVSAVASTQFRKAEVEHLHSAVGANHDVGRLQIAMDDAAGVRRRQGIGDRDRDPQHLAEAHAVAWNERIQALPTHVLHHDEIVAVCRLDFVDGDDVCVIEGRGGVRFLDETTAAVLVADAVRRQHFDRDFAIQSRIARAIHLAHSACADEREDLVGPESCAGLESHASGIRRHYRGVIDR